MTYIQALYEYIQSAKVVSPATMLAICKGDASRLHKVLYRIRCKGQIAYDGSDPRSVRLLKPGERVPRKRVEKCCHGVAAAHCRCCIPGGSVRGFIRQHPDGATLREVAKVFGVSRERIRQIEGKALEKLGVRKVSELQPFAERSVA